MIISQQQWTEQSGWKSFTSVNFPSPPQIIFLFGTREVLSEERYNETKNLFPDSNILMCSTAGEILDTNVNDNTIALTAVLFEKTSLQFAETNISNPAQSFEIGKELGQKISPENLIHTMVFSDGLLVNGTQLVNGLTQSLSEHVSITGGLVGDGPNFKKTVIGLNSFPASGKIVLIGFYGNNLKIGYGSIGGWDTFGIERKITRSQGNILYELDGKPALALYKEYLREKAKDLPSSGLLFPLEIEISSEGENKAEVVRTLLAVNEDDNSMTFAGDMPEGSRAKLMKANFDRLIDGASEAASQSSSGSNLNNAELAILISCVGRKLVLKERVEEEIEAVHAILGSQAFLTGFYSYGEISPVAPTQKQCRLHNQTMTITTFKED